MHSVRPTVNALRVAVGLSRELAAVAPGRTSAILNGVAILRVWAAEHLWRTLPKPVLLRVVYLGVRFDFAARSRSDVQVLKEMFLERQYAIDGIEPATILDLGSNIGASIAFFRATYPSVRIIGIEPDPTTFERLEACMRTLSGVYIYPWAIADCSGRLPFLQAPQSWESALVAEREAASLDVEAVTLSDLASRLGMEQIDLLKLDVEGAEWLMFNQPSAFDACKTIVGELHLGQSDQTIERATAALANFHVSITRRAGRRANFVARKV
jgi:FkbM family methyltransferase